MEIIKLGLDELKPYEKNAKLHPKEQIQQIKKSIEQFGNNDPIAIWGDDNTIVEGHGRYIALKELGYTEAECIRLDHLTDEERKAYTLAHNKLTMNSDFDFEILDEELKDIIDIDMSDFGFDIDFEDDEDSTTEVEEDDFTEDVESRCKLGDVWQLGEHRLICGDSTDVNVIDRLMDGEDIKLILTDPPYNMDMSKCWTGSEISRRRIKLTDKMGYLCNFNAKEIGYIFKKFNDITIYIFTSKDLVQEYMKLAEGWGFNILIWHKTNPAPLVNNNFLSDVEYVMFFYKGKRVWNNGLRPLDVYAKCYTSSITEGSKETGKIHPTMKPVDMLCKYVRLSSNENDVVLNLFGGSGSTLIACEQLNRKCYMAEISPHYVDVIVQRYINLKGSDEDVYLIRDGKKIPYSEVLLQTDSADDSEDLPF